MDEIKKQLSENKEILKKSILHLQKVLGHLYQLNVKKLNNKLIFIKKGVDKVNSAQRHLSSLKLSFEMENKDISEIKGALKEAVASVSKVEKLLEIKGGEIRRSSVNSTSIINFRRDMDELHLAYSCLKNLDTDMGLEEKDFDKNEIKAMRL